VQHNRDLASILDMHYSAMLIVQFVAGMDEAAFAEDDKTQSAVIHRLLVLGESANRVSASFQAWHEEIPWRELIGMRNVLIHCYEEVRLSLVWQAATVSVPRLIEQLSVILPPSANA